MPETRIDLLRHGQCQGGEIFRGSFDVALTDEGWRAMAAQVNRFAPPPWQRIISSPLQRCQRFARETAERLNLPLTLEADFREMHFGAWEGREYAHIRATDEQLRLWSEDPEQHTPPGGEPLAQVDRRVRAALERTLEVHSGERLLLISHGGVMRLLICQALGLPRRVLREIDVPYAHLVSVIWDGERLSLLEEPAGA